MYANELERLREEASAQRPAPVSIAPADEVGFDGRDLSGLRSRDVLRLQRSAGNQTVARMLAQTHRRLIQRDDVGGVDVNKGGGMPSWEWGGKTYHLNTRTDPPHITEEGRDESKAGKKGRIGATKTHYFFRPVLNGTWQMKDAIGSGGYPGSKKKFSALPPGLQSWFETNYAALL